MPSKVHERAYNPGLQDGSFADAPLQQVRTMFITFLQGLFQGAYTGQYKWDPDEERTEIVIRDENPLKVLTVGQRPAINITMGAVQFYSLGIDDMLYYDYDTGRKTKGVLVPGTVTINCCSRVDIEAHNIAWKVAEYVWLLREEFMRRGFFELGRGNQILPPSPPGAIVANDSADEWFCSQVIIPWQFQRKSAFTKLGMQVVDDIRLRLQMAAPRPIGSFGYPQGGHEVPINQAACPPSSFAPQASDAQGGTPSPTGSNTSALPLQPHPLNPSQMVVVRPQYPNRAGLRGPMMNGRPLPLQRPCVKESNK